jgi:hypothetical protein
MGICDADIPVTRQAIRELNHLIMAAGGRRYRNWLAAKQIYDAQTVFGSNLFQGDSVLMPLQCQLV